MFPPIIYFMTTTFITLFYRTCTVHAQKGLLAFILYFFMSFISGNRNTIEGGTKLMLQVTCFKKAILNQGYNRNKYYTYIPSR